MLALCGASSPWEAKAPSDPDVVRAAQDYYANELSYIHFTNVTVIEHGSFAMLEALNGEIGIQALLRSDARGWHVAIPGKDVVPADLIDLYYHPPKAVTRALVSSNCRSPRWYHPVGDPPSVIVRSYDRVAPARELLASTSPGGPRRLHIRSERYRVCIE